MTIIKTFLNRFFIKPFTVRGIFWGTLDLSAKILGAAIWLFVLKILAEIFYNAVFVVYNPKERIWWFAYCTVMFLGASLIAYAPVFVRRDY
ncbi:hypothetical protein Emin_0679 [Elusimicrobium minutum Pei191]|uniref:Uncharacterized protein n=1 Tax=Elusimicrobium minutum (strain Pei191) TaxID=445932 RepID=B2KCA7_ELUMP|nr:hypothetical protein [Elusimicrobium minutum]ACC98234.1 hypothetical protein Emin_0679 [Elusimicrobium minutum Pei191]